ncbi:MULTISPECIES: ABC transporter ATP-binding protein [unclassified Pseudomonas]|jgi:peptide/nickel transport system ATP-binding protein|uniref:ABC transporter ATP-binding protein n=1 Tax=Pseudomonas TaxID=286 RepID=UPI000D0133CE|nr:MULTISPECIES: ABC transporter ATP-binding protein [unclassified Pseudomonas]MDR2319820.1 ABC transporter ATP-binding protein [Pseudomonas sp.]PRN04697.1 peptide ABC transporter ATP-binding protein [Pseudomonas sp. LLC-1]PYG80969.1 peptide/nickel transport system ATP-binding protein [Pseudomonas sp. RV120224-01c]PYG84662.1 peptide/nickel transport system ATP-binding protein [Pseudomonas sp. RV120224-01b]
MSAVKLNVESLNVRFVNGKKVMHAVRDVSFTLGREKLAIVGESGSGKSTVGRSLLKLHPGSAQITAKALQFGDVDLLSASEKAMQKIRGQRISMIMQDPKYSLNPVVRVGDQIAEAYLAHHKASRSEARERVLQMLDKVHIRDPKRVYDLYPHEVSGGMGQRIMIAMMVITNPEVIIADEPTSALDVSVRQQVLNVLEELVVEQQMGLIFVSHDLNLVRNYCDRVLVMYAGRVVESLAASDLHRAEHPYTRGLLAALPSMDNRRPRLPVLQRDPLWLSC